jgi:hypothetical protein
MIFLLCIGLLSLSNQLYSSSNHNYGSSNQNKSRLVDPVLTTFRTNPVKQQPSALTTPLITRSSSADSLDNETSSSLLYERARDSILRQSVSSTDSLTEAEHRNHHQEWEKRCSKIILSSVCVAVVVIVASINKLIEHS